MRLKAVDRLNLSVGGNNAGNLLADNFSARTGVFTRRRLMPVNISTATTTRATTTITGLRPLFWLCLAMLKNLLQSTKLPSISKPEARRRIPSSCAFA
jgi:hypothetical protein